MATIAILMLSSSVSGKDIKGRAVDMEGSPLEFVNAVLLQDSTFTIGTITNSNGEFRLSSDITTGLILRLSSIGYDTKFVDIPLDGELGEIKMTAANFQMNGVVVRGNASKTYLRGSSLVTNVENSVLANAGTAKDVLRQIPMIVENNGNIEVFGKGVPAIYEGTEKVNF